MKFLLFVCAFWISMFLVHCDDHKQTKNWKSCKKGQYRSVTYACKKKCVVSAEISFAKGGDALIFGRHGTNIDESTDCNEHCFCKYGVVLKKKKRVCVRKPDVALKKKVNFVLKCEKDTNNLAIHLEGNGQLSDSPAPAPAPDPAPAPAPAPATKPPPVTKAPEKIHEQDIGDLKQGKRKFLKVDCSGECHPSVIYVAHKSDSDVDLYGGLKKFVADGIKCYGDHCFCVAASAHSKIDQCQFQGKVKASSYYVTVVGYQDSKDVKVFINDKNLDKVTVEDM